MQTTRHQVCWFKESSTTGRCHRWAQGLDLLQKAGLSPISHSTTGKLWPVNLRIRGCPRDSWHHLHHGTITAPRGRRLCGRQALGTPCWGPSRAHIKCVQCAFCYVLWLWPKQENTKEDFKTNCGRRQRDQTFVLEIVTAVSGKAEAKAFNQRWIQAGHRGTSKHSWGDANY